MDWNEILTPVVVTLVATGGTIITTLVGVLLNEFKRYFVAKTDRAIINTTVDRVADVVHSVVISMNQTIVNNIKEKSEDGKLTEEEIMEIGELTMKQLKCLLTVDVMDTLSEIYGDAEAYLRARVETEVNDVKHGIIGAIITNKDE